MRLQTIMTSLRRTLAEGLQKDKLPGLPVFATALRCLPYMLPEPWDASRIAAELPGTFVLGLKAC